MYLNFKVFDLEAFNQTEIQIHHAAQFLAMAGKHFIENKSDDSNTNLGFENDLLISRPIMLTEKSFQLFVDPKNWLIGTQNMTGDVIESKELAGSTKDDVLHWLRNQLEKEGLNGDALKYIDHYEIPKHALDEGSSFQSLNQEVVKTWIQSRNNAKVLLNDLNKIVGIDSEIRIWPHHFDTGTYYAFGEKKAIGAGWAMADALVDNPYLYIYGWNGDGSIDYSNLPTLEIGKWLVQENWQGIIVPLKVIIEDDSQYQKIINSISNTVEFYKSQLNNKL